MTTISKEIRVAAYVRPLLATPLLRFLALLALCSAYIQGPLMKVYDFDGAIAEMNHFALTPAPLFAVGVVVFELAMSALILLGIFRWAAALCLAGFTVAATFLAFRFWELARPAWSA